MTQPKTEKLSFKRRIRALVSIGVTTYKAAPLAAISQLASALFNALLPLLTAYFAALTTTALVSAYAGEAEAGARAIEYVIITALLGVVRFSWSTVEGYVNQQMEYRIDAAVSDQMYEHFLSLDFWRYDDKETADLYEKANRFSQLFPRIFRQVSDILSSIFTMVAGIIAMFVVNWVIGLITVVAIVPGVIIQLRLTRLQTNHWNSNIHARRVVNWIEYGMMQPDKIGELRLYGLVQHLLQLRRKMRNKDEAERLEYERKYLRKRIGADALEAGAELIGLIWITTQIIARRQPVGQFLFVQQVLTRAIGGAKSFIRGIATIDEDLANLFDYEIFMSLPAGRVGSGSVRTVPNSIAINNVSFNYPGLQKNVLSKVTMTIKKGQKVAIVGENGAGKSTLVKILSGLYEPSTGSIELDGVPLQEVDVSSWHKNIAVLSQDFIKYDFVNARSNIIFGDIKNTANDKPIDEAIHRAEADFLYDLPQGLETYVDQWMEDEKGNKGQDISGGQWQRLALARNFYRNSPIVILDEPTSAIDALAESRIFKNIFEHSDNTVIVISHRLTTIKKADIVYMMKEGKIVEEGTVQELIKRRGEFYLMFESQIN